MMQQILVAGDNDTAARIHKRLQAFFSRRGGNAVYCASFAELKQRVKERPPSAIFLHFENDDLTTYELYRDLRESTNGRTVPVLALETEIFDSAASPVETLVVFEVPLMASTLIRRLAGMLHTNIGPGGFDVDEVLVAGADDGEEDDAEQENMEREREKLRELNIRLHGDPTDEPEFFFMSDAFRRRWFYNSSMFQRFLDWIEDSSFYQNRARCRWRKGKL